MKQERENIRMVLALVYIANIANIGTGTGIGTGTDYIDKADAVREKFTKAHPLSNI